jgi:hypothetical protein
MIRTRFRHVNPRPLLPALREYARRSVARRTLTREERRNLAAGNSRPAVYSASLGCHPHF